MLDDIEKWVVEHYGPITADAVDFPQFSCEITAVAVRLFDGVAIGMGMGRQRAIHDLYLKLTGKPELTTSLPVWWQERREDDS